MEVALLTLEGSIAYLERIFEQFPRERQRKYGKEYETLLKCRDGEIEPCRGWREKDPKSVDSAIRWFAGDTAELIEMYPRVEDLIEDYLNPDLKRRLVQEFGVVADGFWRERYTEWGKPPAEALSLRQFFLIKRCVEEANRWESLTP